MKRTATLTKRLLKVFLVVLALAALGAGLFYWQVIQPRRELRSLLENRADDVPDAVLRKMCHRCIRWRRDHDSFIYLQEVGDESSLPYLIRALGRMGEIQMCTKGHCVDALEAISGEKFGEDVEAWERWLERR